MRRIAIALFTLSYACGGPGPSAETDRAATTRPNFDLASVTSLPRLGPVEALGQVERSGPSIELPFTLPINTGRIPDLGPGAPMFFSSGSSFSFPNGTAPGSASFSGAPVIDWNSMTQPTFGSGAINVTVAGVTYNYSNAESAAEVFVDPSTNSSYLVLTSFILEVDAVTMVEIGTVVHVVVPSADFAPGATVAFDGVDRLAFFARGDISLPEPTIVAVAATGSVNFTAGGLNIGDLIDATTSGDFGEITLTPQNPPPPTGGSITPGTYTLSYDPMAYVQCDGTLAGQESAFASQTLAGLGFTNGTITLAAAPTGFDASGAPILSGYGVQSLLLENTPDMPPGLFGAFTNGTGSGPLGTNFMGVYLVLDGDSATATSVYGGTGAGWMTQDQQGFCSVDFSLQLTP